MSTINSQEDFLRALRENPEWREAVRAQILGDELLGLPAALQVLTETLTKFIAQQEEFNRRQEEFNQRQEEFNQRQEEFNRRQEECNQRQEQFNQNAIARFERMESDMSGIKGEYARSRTVEDARGIASDMNLEYVRTLTRDGRVHPALRHLARCLRFALGDQAGPSGGAPHRLGLET